MRDKRRARRVIARPYAMRGNKGNGQDENETMLTVATSSDPKSVAGSIAHCIRDGVAPVVVAGSAASINQALKSFIIARQYLNKEDTDCRAGG